MQAKYSPSEIRIKYFVILHVLTSTPAERQIRLTDSAIVIC